MDEIHLRHYEKAALHFFPFQFEDFFDEIQILNKICVMIPSSIEQCRKHFLSIADEGTNIAILNEKHTHLETFLLSKYQQTITKLLNKMDEIMQLMPESEEEPQSYNTEELEKELSQLERKYMEQDVFQKHLKQELSDFAELRPLLRQVTNIKNTSNKIRTLKIPSGIVDQVINTVRCNSNVKYHLKDLHF